MLSTIYGDFDGNSWELLCQRCFKMRHGKDQYIDMPATPGDFGIEGFTKTGLAFQCYCPDKLYTPKGLYEAQRNKITTDLRKLIKFKKELSDRLNGTKIKEWHFYTPNFSKNDIITHCAKKTTEYRNLNLNILDLEFEVLPRDIDFLLPELSTALSISPGKVSLRPSAVVDDKVITSYKNSQSSLIKNAIRKHSQRFLQKGVSDSSGKVSTLTDNTIQHYLNGRSIITEWQKLAAEEYERFTTIQSLYESKVQEMCMFPSANHNLLLNEINSGVEQKISTNFSHLDGITIERLKNYIIADWILRCPIEFE